MEVLLKNVDTLKTYRGRKPMGHKKKDRNRNSFDCGPSFVSCWVCSANQNGIGSNSRLAGGLLSELGML